MTSKYTLGSIRYTIRSSITPPCSLHSNVYCAWPTAIFAYVIGQQMIQHRLGIRPRDEHFAHVADVEQPDPLAHRGVFLQDAAVHHRHLPTAKRDHLRAPFQVRGVKRRALQLFGTRHQRALR